MYKVYHLYDSTDLDQSPRYIGFTTVSLDVRLKRHKIDFRSAFKSGKKLSKKDEWIRTVLELGGSIQIKLISNHQTQEEALSHELEIMLTLDNLTNSKLYKTHITIWSDKDKDKFRDRRANIIKQYTLTGILIKQWKSIKQVEKVKGYDHSAIGKCCKGELSTYKGYFWLYEHDDVNERIKSNKLLKDKRKYKIKIHNIQDNSVVYIMGTQDAADYLGVCKSSIKSSCLGIINLIKSKFKVSYETECKQV